ncbi:MAG: NAD+ synthase [Myxococcales bacterium]|nr:NAD+ synthase [Myxococcales bacterium]
MRIALCQINPTVGALQENCKKIVTWAERAEDQGALVAVFSELAISGYPPRDLLDRPQFVQDNMAAIETLAGALPPNLYVLVGAVHQAALDASARPHNSVAVMHKGHIIQWIHKRLLPAYDVFDEGRYFVAGGKQATLDILGTSIGVSICEDAWNDVAVLGLENRYTVNPIDDLVNDGAKILINVAASPFAISKFRPRTKMLAAIAKRHVRPLVFVNQIGGNDDLIFDGHSAVFGPDGNTWHLAASFAEDMVVTDLGPRKPSSQLPEDECAIKKALVLGIRDYAKKCGFSRAVLGLSGGVDSALCAVLAAEALGPSNVLGVGMSTRHTSEASVTDAMALVANLNIEWRHIDIDTVYTAYERMLASVLDAGLAPKSDATFENVQSRIRGASLMAISNRFGHLVLSTGNKSELAMGYCTLYGDMAGGLAVLSDIPKTMIYRVAEAINREAGQALIPQNILDRPPSAELRPNQRDTDTLPPYDVLDPILEGVVENGMSEAALVSKGYEASIVRKVIQAVSRNEYKRRQMPPGLIVTRKAFGPGRRYPIAQKYKPLTDR